MTKDEALRLALEALEYTGLKWPQVDQAITAIKAALEAKDAPVAVAWANRNGTKFVGNGRKWIHQDCVIPLYTAPPQRKPLTDEQVEAIAKEHIAVGTRSFQEFARRIEAAHGIKGEA